MQIRMKCSLIGVVLYIGLKGINIMLYCRLVDADQRQ